MKEIILLLESLNNIQKCIKTLGGRQLCEERAKGEITHNFPFNDNSYRTKDLQRKFCKSLIAEEKEHLLLTAKLLSVLISEIYIVFQTNTTDNKLADMMKANKLLKILAFRKEKNLKRELLNNSKTKYYLFALKKIYSFMENPENKVLAEPENNEDLKVEVNSFIRMYGRRLKNWREYNGYSVKFVADKLGTHSRIIKNIEEGNPKSTICKFVLYMNFAKIKL